MGNNNFKKWFIRIFWLFMIGSLIGCIVETIVAIVQKGHFEFRQGVIYGPLIPIYGIGTVVYYLTISKIKNLKLVFLISMVLGGFVEFMSSYIQELCFGTVSWDYSNLLFNIGGRTSILHCIYWGIAGVLFVKLIYPYIFKLDKLVDNTNFVFLTTALTVFMIFNLTISCLAGSRQYERYNNISASSKMDYFLDKHYPDSMMNKIFANAIYK